jgi:hypothetical protein
LNPSDCVYFSTLEGSKTGRKRVPSGVLQAPKLALEKERFGPRLITLVT